MTHGDFILETSDLQKRFGGVRAVDGVDFHLRQGELRCLIGPNGAGIGSGEGEAARVYQIPAKLLKAGDNLIVVNVLDFWGNGGMHGPAEQRAFLLADGTRVPLTGWEYQLRAGRTCRRRMRPGNRIAGINMLYNAMIAPLGKYGLRGVAWYQGEANAGPRRRARYQALLAALMADWRRQFDAPLPFLIVQLANFGKLVDRAGR